MYHKEYQKTKLKYIVYKNKSVVNIEQIIYKN